MEGLPGELRGLKLGDYVQQTIGSKRYGRFRLPCYAFAPEENTPMKMDEQGACQGTYFGPVHEIRDTRKSTGFVSIRVPMPWVKYGIKTQLVWINVCKCKPGDSWQSCTRVSIDEVRHWERRGWWHKWIVDEHGAYREHRIR